ncbi:PPOX class F420-dependent oxidoreductase [Dietzia sp. SLG310A2-38A2]|nr:PPOX class F420-dependent oxidoreductase [Dietzia sp. SLG310A2-38A2]MBB1031965.1 PPOX class F420-dependent oxidoreductase [Dietzia sp. SLG310A2-38A2]
MTDDLRDLLAQPNPCVMATLRRDGSPVTVPTWYRLVGDRIHLNLDAGRVRLQHLRRDPRVALSVLDADDWYSHVSIQGRITEIAEDPDLSGIDSLSRHYTDQPYPVRDRARVDAWVEIERVHTWGSAARS